MREYIIGILLNIKTFDFMNELYWVTRLDAANFILLICLIIGCMIVMLSTAILLDKRGDDDFHNDDDNYILCKNVLRTSSFITFIICMLYILIPTQKQALVIWGIGGTIDYIKSNDTAKQIPDKCINALDKFIDEYVNGDNNENKKNKEE